MGSVLVMQRAFECRLNIDGLSCSPHTSSIWGICGVGRIWQNCHLVCNIKKQVTPDFLITWTHWIIYTYFGGFITCLKFYKHYFQIKAAKHWNYILIPWWKNIKVEVQRQKTIYFKASSFQNIIQIDFSLKIYSKQKTFKY